MAKKNLFELFEELMTELNGVARASSNTITAYRKDLLQFIEFCSEHNISFIHEVKERTIRNFIIKLSEDNSQKSTISRKLSAIRKLFDFAIRNNEIESNPMAKISNPKLKRKLPNVLNLDSYLEIYKLILKENGSLEAKKMIAIFELLYGCALRVSELCSLNIGQIDLHNESIRVLGKGSKTRIVPIGSKSMLIIKDYLDSLQDKNYNSPLFFTDKGKRINRFYVYSLVKKYISQVSDIEKKSPHILRHSAATHMLDNDADIMAVKEILGHENLSTTQIYTHVSIERLKRSYKKAHPKS